MRWIQGFINTGTLYLPRPDGRGKYIILGLRNPGIHRILMYQCMFSTLNNVSLNVYYYKTSDNVFSDWLTPLVTFFSHKTFEYEFVFDKI
jgi:hypothetical protein